MWHDVSMLHVSSTQVSPLKNTITVDTVCRSAAAEKVNAVVCKPSFAKEEDLSAYPLNEIDKP